MTSLDLRLWLAVIVEFAPALRDAGVTCIKSDSYSIELTPATPQPLAREARTEPTDPMSDAVTFGGKVPGYRKMDSAGD